MLKRQNEIKIPIITISRSFFKSVEDRNVGLGIVDVVNSVYLPYQTKLDFCPLKHVITVIGFGIIGESIAYTIFKKYEKKPFIIEKQSRLKIKANSLGYAIGN